ncbi:MAG: oligosaccharide flippase family protein [Candidatus Aenigmarchaeota archaeon]|nr:oligosaccharide flippase family protein [Candidatus Aenigmarchaeota archaeon]
MDNDSKIIAKGAMFVFAGIVISKPITYLWRIYIARYIGHDAYGIFSIALALLGLINVFAILGFSSGLFRYTSFYFARKKYADAKGVLITVFSINSVSCLFFSCLLVFFAPYFAENFFHNINTTGPVYVVAFILPFFVFSNHFLALLTVKLRADYNALIKNVLEGIIKIFATIALVWLGYSAIAAILGYFIAIFGTFVLSAYFLFFKTDYGIILKSKAKYHSRNLVNYSIPLMITGFVSGFLTYTDTIMLSYFKGVSQTGIYNAALPTAQLIAIASCFSVLFFPLFVENYSKKNYKEMNKLYITTVKWIFLIALPMVFVIMFFPGVILNFLWGAEYVGGTVALTILAIGYFVSNVCAPTGGVLKAIEKQNIVLMVTICGSILNVILNYSLIPVFGMAGAAGATATSIVFIYSAYLFFVHKYTGFFPFNVNLLKGFFATLIAFAFTYFAVKLIFPVTPLFALVPALGIYSIMYFFIMVKFKVIDKDDLKLLRALGKKSGLDLSFLERIVMRMCRI